MDIKEIFISIILGAISGWLAGFIMNSKGSLLRNIILGILGGFVGGYVFNLLGLAAKGLMGTMIVSVVGACLVIIIVNKLFK